MMLTCFNQGFLVALFCVASSDSRTNVSPLLIFFWLSSDQQWWPNISRLSLLLFSPCTNKCLLNVVSALKVSFPCSLQFLLRLCVPLLKPVSFVSLYCWEQCSGLPALSTLPSFDFTLLNARPSIGLCLFWSWVPCASPAVPAVSLCWCGALTAEEAWLRFNWGLTYAMKVKLKA